MTHYSILEKRRFNNIEPIDGEIWSFIDEYPTYRVSNLGRVARVGKHAVSLMRPRLSQDNALQVMVSEGGKPKKKFLISRLVALHFVPNNEGSKFVEFIDGNNMNVAASNLKWHKYTPTIVEKIYNIPDSFKPAPSVEEKEIWKEIGGWEDYEISSFGRLKSNTIMGKGCIMACPLSTSGYQKAKLSKNGKRWHTTVHILVATAFCTKPEGTTQVNHIDTNKANNYFGNLEWCTQFQNNHHTFLMGTAPESRHGTKSGTSKLTDEQILEIREKAKQGYGIQQVLCKEYGITAGTMSDIISRKTWRHI